MTERDDRIAETMTKIVALVPCPKCKAEIGHRCFSSDSNRPPLDTREYVHYPRTLAYRAKMKELQ